MARETIDLYNWMRRYRVTAKDMNQFQDALVASSRAPMEGVFGGAILVGFDGVPSVGLSIEVQPGIGVGPTGFFHSMNDPQTVSFEAPDSLPSRSLVVSRPKFTGKDTITSPTSPFDLVPLRTENGQEIVVIPGEPAQEPDYPAKQPGDLILFGVKMVPGQTMFSTSDIRSDVSDLIGKNSPIVDEVMRFDSRLQPSRESPKQLKIKPSQKTGPKGTVFTYAGSGTPSRFPRDSSGEFVNADSFLDFETGSISGGDEQSPSFTPVIPSGENSVVATVTLRGTDQLQVSFGTEGTYDECFEGIQNQRSSGPGGIQVMGGAYKVAYVIVSSFGGAISDINVIDARPLGGGGGGGAGTIRASIYETDFGNNAMKTRDISGSPAFRFTGEEGQTAASSFIVPSSFQPGTKLSQRLSGSMRPGAAVGVTIRVEATLIRPGEDVGISTNKNTDSVAFASNSLMFQSRDADLTDAQGKINGIEVQPGDLIKILYTEDSGPGAGELDLRSEDSEIILG